MPSASATVANLKEDRIKAKKSLGQNFVTDDSVLLDIAAAAAVSPGDIVLEIGPGTGNLTKHLLQRGARVTAIEKDDNLYARLKEQYSAVPELTLVSGDAVMVNLEAIVRSMIEQPRPLDATPSAASSPASSSSSSTSEAPAAAASSQPAAGSSGGSHAISSSSAAARPGGGRPGGKVKVVANLPYNITKDLLVLMLPLGELVSELHIMIQEEAAQRLTQRKPGGPDWRAMNVRTLFYSRPKYRFRISRLKYFPVPGVDGALVTFQLLPPAARPSVPSERSFMGLVNKAFSERRKMMRNSLQPLYSSPQAEAALEACGLNPQARAQDLTVDQFVALSWKLQEQLLAAPELAAAGVQGGGAAAAAVEGQGAAAHVAPP